MGRILLQHRIASKNRIQINSLVFVQFLIVPYRKYPRDEVENTIMLKVYRTRMWKREIIHYRGISTYSSIFKLMQMNVKKYIRVRYFQLIGTSIIWLIFHIFSEPL